MSICVNNDLIWVATPKCASMSIECAFINSNLNTNHYKYEQNKSYPEHLHIRLSDLYQRFGVKETVVIKRDYFDRWISGLQYLWMMYEEKNYEIIIKWEDINNDFIYETFTPEFIDQIHSLPSSMNPSDLLSFSEINKYKEVLKLITSKLVKPKPKDSNPSFNPYFLLKSQSHWVDNNKCTYEFNISEIDKFENFISNRYNVKFKVCKLNQNKSRKNQIIKDEKLKQWVWDNFEKRFEKRNSLI
jgi:hypothetical protein